MSEQLVDRNSMDILNDDCLALVLSYLPFKDKIRLETVSKRWKRLIFAYQLKSISLKCYDDSDYVMIQILSRRYSPQLKQLDITIRSCSCRMRQFRLFKNNF